MYNDWKKFYQDTNRFLWKNIDFSYVENNDIEKPDTLAEKQLTNFQNGHENFNLPYTNLEEEKKRRRNYNQKNM